VIALSNEHKIFNSLGSFWNSGLQVEAGRKARWLAETSQQNSVSAMILRGLPRLTFGGTQAQAHRLLQVSPTEIVQTAESPRPRWSMPVEDAITPVTILTKRGLRTIGLDFTFSSGALIWSESPHDLFDLPDVPVLCYRESPVSLWNYPLRLDSDRSAPEEVTKYYRSSQDPLQFQKAIAAAAGYTVLPFTSTLRAVLGNRYVFDAGVLEAPYQHVPMTAGVEYPAGTVIGDMVKVRAAPSVGSDWYRDLDWSSGLSLDKISPFQGLRLPDGQRRLSTTSESAAYPGKYHVTAPLEVDSQSGKATVSAGVTLLHVQFATTFASVPHVQGSIAAGNSGELSALSFVLYDVSTLGFNVAFSSSASSDFSFHWRAKDPDNIEVSTLVPAGASSLHIDLPVSASQVPVITGCLQTDSDDAVEVIPHIISLPTTTGFDLLLSAAPSRNMQFNWSYSTPSSGVSRELIPAGSTQISVAFSEEQESVPVILHNLQNADADTSELIPYLITQVTAHGFVLMLSQPTGSDCYFHWTAEKDYEDVKIRFWAHQAAMEDLTGVFVADVVGLSGPGHVSVNLLDLYFQYLLGARGLVVDLKSNSDNGVHLSLAERFIDREKPISAALVVRHI
jgi:hypothetical protein